MDNAECPIAVIFLSIIHISCFRGANLLALLDSAQLLCLQEQPKAKWVGRQGITLGPKKGAQGLLTYYYMYLMMFHINSYWGITYPRSNISLHQANYKSNTYLDCVANSAVIVKMVIETLARFSKIISLTRVFTRSLLTRKKRILM